MKKVIAFALVVTSGYLFMSKDKAIEKKSTPSLTAKFKAPIKKVKTKQIIGPTDVVVSDKAKMDKKVSKIKKYKEIKNEYFKEHSKELKVTVSKIKDSKLTISGKSTRVIHILVKANKKNGPTSSYEALVNPKTKQVYRTWNQTKFETNNDFKISANGLEYN